MKDDNEDAEEEVELEFVAAGLTGTIDEEESGEIAGDAMMPSWSAVTAAAAAAPPPNPEYNDSPTKFAELCLDLFEVVTTVCELSEFCEDFRDNVLSVSPPGCDP